MLNTASVHGGRNLSSPDMARRNPALRGRIPAPHEPVKECASCEDHGRYVQVIVAAKWPDDFWYRHEDPGCSPGGHRIPENNAEYYCPDCHLVFENIYDGPMEGPNWFPSRAAAVRFLGKSDRKEPEDFPWETSGPCDGGATRPRVFGPWRRGSVR